MPGRGHTINKQTLEDYQNHLEAIAKRKEVEDFVEEIRDWYNNTDRYEPGEGDRQVKQFYRSVREDSGKPRSQHKYCLLGTEKYHQNE